MKTDEKELLMARFDFKNCLFEDWIFYVHINEETKDISVTSNQPENWEHTLSEASVFGQMLRIVFNMITRKGPGEEGIDDGFGKEFTLIGNNVDDIDKAS